MKFDYCIGNPPYQENIENRGEQPPLYHYFYNAAEKISNKTMLITPGRFLFDAGKTPSVWNQKMLNNPHFKVIKFYENSKSIFNNVDIKGGIAIGYIDNKTNFGKLEIFIKDELLKSILYKVEKYKENNISTIMYSNTSYKYNQCFFNENKDFINRVSGGSKRYLSSSVFEKFPEVFFDKKPNDNNEYYKIIGRLDNERCYKYINSRYLLPPDNILSYKVIVPASNGSGALGETITTPLIGTPLIGTPLIGHTETFISFGNYNNIESATNLLKYIKSKFARVMLGIKKVTQGNKTAKVWEYVPLQDFTTNSDIDWSKSIKEIDQQLYKKYGLSQEEIDFIETKVKEME